MTKPRASLSRRAARIAFVASEDSVLAHQLRQRFRFEEQGEQTMLEFLPKTRRVGEDGGRFGLLAGDGLQLLSASRVVEQPEEVVVGTQCSATRISGVVT